METPTTLLDAIRKFADEDAAREYFVKLRWPNGVACPRMGCGNANVQYIKTRKLWRCKECKRDFTAKVGTIFEDSPIGFNKWLPAIWLITANRNGISSCEVGRAIGVTQATAWFMLHRIRLAMQDGSFERLSGEIEADETYIGPKARSTNRRGPKSPFAKGPGANKVTVMGLRQRGGQVRAFVVKDTRASTLLPQVWRNVVPGSTVYTDSLGSYHRLSEAYVHRVINHAKTYVEGQVHTNSIENFWSVLKRTLGGTYIAPRPQHLDAYLDEQIFRYNERENQDGPRFVLAAKGADGKRLTYRQLTARGDA